MNTIGEGKPWRFSHFRKTDGYANMPLDGMWLRAPYLHNGSVPTLRALLFPEKRPAEFYRAYDVYDWDNVGFVAAAPTRSARASVRHAAKGNSNTRPHLRTGTPAGSARGSPRIPENPLSLLVS